MDDTDMPAWKRLSGQFVAKDRSPSIYSIQSLLDEKDVRKRESCVVLLCFNLLLAVLFGNNVLLCMVSSVGHA